MNYFKDIPSCRRAVCMISALAVAAMLAGCSGQPEETTLPAQTESVAVTESIGNTQPVELTVEELDGRMVVTTSWCQVSYPFAFEELIQVTTEETGGVRALCFTARIGEEEIPLYDIRFGGNGGSLLGRLAMPVTGVNVDVFGVLHEPGNLTDEQVGTFRAVQETFNEVCESLMENPGFTPAE